MAHLDELMLEMIDSMDDEVDQAAEEIIDIEDDLVYGDSDGDIIDAIECDSDDCEDDHYHADLDYDEDDDQEEEDDDDCCENPEDDVYIENGLCPKCGNLLIDCTCEEED